MPRLSKLNLVLVTQFIETKLISEEILLCYCKTNFDIHQRVPTQIDRFKLLKSFAFRSVLLKADGHSSELAFSVKHFLKFNFLPDSVLLITLEALWHMPSQWGRIIGFSQNIATTFS
ncbi:hypothetical protein F0226_19850 [Vibrio sp. 99-70-13A1]|nr:hypothetical protein [Vibrio sp. 99-70-13A1]